METRTQDQAAQKATGTGSSFGGTTQNEAGTVDRNNLNPHTYPERNRRFFAWEHLKPELAAISRPFAEAADRIIELPSGDQRNEAFKYLLLAKDAAVRAGM